MISPKEILQINATIIAGLLILVGIIASTNIEKSFENISTTNVITDNAIIGNATIQNMTIQNMPNEILTVSPYFDVQNPRDWAYFAGVSFGASSIFAIFISVFRPEQITGWAYSVYVASIGTMGAGFVFLSYGFLLLGL